MKKPCIKDQLIAAIDELLGTTKLNLDEMELETHDAKKNAAHVRNKAIQIRATKPRSP